MINYCLKDKFFVTAVFAVNLVDFSSLFAMKISMVASASVFNVDREFCVNCQELLP
jgi:hypothetical protein